MPPATLHDATCQPWLVDQPTAGLVATLSCKSWRSGRDLITIADVRRIRHGPPPMETNNNTVDTTSDKAAPVGRFVELQQLVARMATDFEKFYKDGNKAAGTRIRVQMQELKTFAQTVRTEVQAMKNEGAEKA